MENLLEISKTIDTPHVQFNAGENMLLVEGKSYPENTHEFYKPVVEWVENYVKTVPKQTTFNMKLIYFSSSSYKPLLDIFLLLEELKQKGKQVSINWFYKNGDIDMEEAGQEFEDLIDLDFSYHNY